jgi:hypothetical protein
MYIPVNNSQLLRKEYKMAGKYAPLQQYITNLPISQRDVTISFVHVERILNEKLPTSASRYRAWWANDETHTHAHAWMDVGWKVDTVDLSQKWVRLLRFK